MRIIAGKARGVELTAPSGLGVRPTAGRAREALFSMLGDSLRGISAVDLFAGSGALGLEAASRGAAEVTLVERNPQHCQAISDNISMVQRCGVDAAFSLINADVLDLTHWLSAAAGAELIFADPPYDDSAADFAALFGMADFHHAFAGAEVIWEVPDRPGSVGAFAAILGESDLDWNLRKVGGISFLRIRMMPAAK